VPWGYLAGVLVVAIATAAALSGPRARPSYVRYLLGFVMNEVPTVGLLWLGFATVLAFGNGDVESAGGRAVVGLALVTAGGLLVLTRRALRADDAVARALEEGLGADRVGPRERRGWLRRRLRLAGVLLAPIVSGRVRVRRVADISYGEGGVRNLLDLYQRRSGTTDGPTLVYLHGGSFRRGRKSREARALLHRLARGGWTCISATYRLSPVARFPDHVVDAKKVVAWVRVHGPKHGANPSVVVVAGSSAGAHLAALAALTPNEPDFQPGFETVDTSVAAAVCLYGYFGGVAGASGRASSPAAYVGPGAPPFFVAHGDADTLVQVHHARAFVRRLRGASSAPVVYAELPGGQHGFDLFRSVRFEAVIDGVEAFVAEALPGSRA
jgi:acetyl esterase/lipase